jgi:hypothetical protein
MKSSATPEPSLHRLRVIAALAALTVALSSCTTHSGGDDEETSPPLAAGTDGPTLTSNLERVSLAGPHLITGVHFEHASKAELVMCGPDVASKPAGAACDYRTSTAVEVEADGSIAVDFDVRSFITLAGHEINCLEQPCSVATTGSGGARVLSQLLITWDPSATLPDPPSLTAVVTKLRPGPWSTAVVNGTGFVPRSWVRIVQCPAEGPRAVADEDCLYAEGGGRLRADAVGNIEGHLPVAPMFDRSNGERIDCSTRAICVIAVLPDPKEPTQRLAVAPLELPQPGD